MTVALLAFAAAHGQTNDATTDMTTCEPAWLADVLPADGSVDVPTNVSPLLLLHGGNCRFDVSLTIEDMASVVAFDVLSLRGGPSPWFEQWTLAEDLAPNTRYAFTIGAIDGERTVQFETGSSLQEPGLDPGEARLDPVVSFSVEEGPQVAARIQVPFVLTVENLGTDRVATASIDGLPGRTYFGEGETMTWAGEAMVPLRQDLCARVTVASLTGESWGPIKHCEVVVQPPAEESPVRPVDRGCATAPAGRLSFLALAMLWVWPRRQRVTSGAS